MENLWLHSLACAYAARLIAKKLMIGDAEKFFLMGLIHDIGKVPLLNVLSQILPPRRTLDKTEIISSIQEVHANFGSILLRRWGFPGDYVSIASLHEGPDFEPETENLVLIVNCANNLVRKLGYGMQDDSEINLADLKSAQLLELDSEALEVLGEEVKQLMSVSVQFF
jgi:HD-like signal output (HDOD) protein